MDRHSLKRFFQRIRLTGGVNNKIEVGFAHVGPTLGLTGTLHVDQRVVFIHDICVYMKTEATTGEHRLGWFAFRPPQNPLGDTSNAGARMASKFLMAPDDPVNFNILFADQNQHSEMKALYEKITFAWERFLKDQSTRFQASAAEAFKKFIKLQNIHDIIKELEGTYYWEPATYSARLVVLTKNNQPIFEEQKTFTLTAEDNDALNENINSIIYDLCRQPGVRYKMRVVDLR